MQASDVTVEILRSIRDEIHGTREELRETRDHLGARIDETNRRVDEMREELSRRIVESEIRTSTAITDLAGTVREMTSVLRSQHDLRPRVERCERDIEELKRRSGS